VKSNLQCNCCHNSHGPHGELEAKSDERSQLHKFSLVEASKGRYF
jgi:hypothetical protein